MKKHLFSGLLLVLIFQCSAQEAFKSSSEGFNAVIVDVPGRSIDEIYTQVKQWVNVTYKNPSEVIVLDDRSNIRVRGYSDDGMAYMHLSLDFTYLLNIEIKENKYRLSFSVEDITTNGQATFHNYPTGFYKKTGEPKGPYVKSIESLELYANALAQGIKSRVLGEASDTSDW